MVVCAYNPSCSGGWGRELLEMEVAVSWDNIALQPGWQSKTPSQGNVIIIIIIMSWVWWWMPVLSGIWGAEVWVRGCGEPWLHHRTPAWVTEWEPVSKQNKIITMISWHMGWGHHGRKSQVEIPRVSSSHKVQIKTNNTTYLGAISEISSLIKYLKNAGKEIPITAPFNSLV